MLIYHLKKPFYPESYCLEIDEKHSWELPSVKCRACWGLLTNHHLFIRQDLPEGRPLWKRHEHHVWPQEFALIAEKARKALQLAADIPLLPGTRIHRLYVRATCVPSADFEWPDLFRCVITERVRQFMTNNGFTGWHVEPAIITKTPAKVVIPPFYELVVDGRGGKPIVEPPIEVGFFCEECGAAEYQSVVPTRLELDEREWDGSDLFHFHGFFSPYVFVSERFAQALEMSSLSNYELESMEVFLEGIRERHKPSTGTILDSYTRETMLKQMRKIFGDDYPEWALLGRRGKDQSAILPIATEAVLDNSSIPSSDLSAKREDIPSEAVPTSSQAFVRSCTHSLVFPKKSQAKQVTSFLKDQGLLAEFEKLGECWVVYVAHAVPMDEDLTTSESFKALLDMLEEIATTHGGEYMEWMATTKAL